jgi:peptidoglycan-associated lipoprotein
MRNQSSLRILFTVAALAGSLALLGCPKRPEVAQAGPGAVGPGPAPIVAPPAPIPAPRIAETPVTRPAPPAETPVQPVPAPATPAPSAVPPPSQLKDVFFEFDRFQIRNDQKAALDENVTWLKANSRVKVSIEGHCDERGTPEYNLALGERRAKAIMNYLVGAGIAADRIVTVSYGEERPFVLGHDEAAWKWNRRGHFVITGQ